MKRKFYLDTRLLKRGVLLLIVFALAGFMIAGIIGSFGKDHVLAMAKTPAEYIPSGSYEDYLKVHSGKPIDALDEYELEFSELPLPKLDADIVVPGKIGRASCRERV